MYVFAQDLLPENAEEITATWIDINNIYVLKGSTGYQLVLEVDDELDDDSVFGWTATVYDGDYRHSDEVTTFGGAIRNESDIEAARKEIYDWIAQNA